MRTVFADSFYWIALANRRDEWHAAAVDVGKRLGHFRIVTTDEVLVEFLAFFSGKGGIFREASSKLVRAIVGNPNVTVMPQTRDSFLSGLSLFESRMDKEYSLVDCISMQTMCREGLSEVLTHDHHFAQEGFTLLLTDKSP